MLSAIAGSIWSGATFTAYIYRLTGNDAKQGGYVSCVWGVMQVVSAPFCGWLSDKFSDNRADILRLSALVDLTVGSWMFVSVWFRFGLWSIYVGIISWALFYSL